ncbi:hypothetical protein [Pediococcus acidilactici]|jgi:hypothetical protein|uniref:Sporulation protein Cse60 n=1 Tax=Pediococcus acidilactici TaxID=1254 RepID=A0AAW8YGC4_PEDAC|nr:hypothetical protein [Pediococcus acidilactici]MDV2621172.1 hypothetical protein [Pediococcus acidilactici]
MQSGMMVKIFENDYRNFLENEINEFSADHNIQQVSISTGVNNYKRYYVAVVLYTEN